MNKKLEEYKKKSNRIIKTIKLIGIYIFILAILISIVEYAIKKSESNQEKMNASTGDSEYEISLKDNTVIYENKLDINLNIRNFDYDSNYKVIITMNNKNVLEEQNLESSNKFTINLKSEGEKKTNIIIYKNSEEKFNKTLSIYYIEPYKEQFLDSITQKGVGVHYGVNDVYEKYDISLEMVKMLGAKIIRTDIYRDRTPKVNGEYDFSYYDNWINEANEKNINILIIFNGMPKLITEDIRKAYKNFTSEIINRYPNIKKYEILNEPNYSKYVQYITDEDIKKYIEMVSITKEIISQNAENKSIYMGSTANVKQTTDTNLSGLDFLEKIIVLGGYKYTNDISYHIYDGSASKIQNEELKYYLMEYKNLFNKYGGFITKNVTEYGVSTYLRNTDEIQADKIIQQTVLMDKYGTDMALLYHFWNAGIDINEHEYNFGLVRNDYTPKLSYYAMKNYYQNTNGAEYIGNLNIQSGLEAHVYDKDGKPLIIAWSDNTDNTFDFYLNNMTAKDLYGKEITPDENGNIQITTSPVYLYNVDNSYFYQAISNVATDKYDEFTEKFASEIVKVTNLQENVSSLKQAISKVDSTCTETTAINLMKANYKLGDKILEAYKTGSLQIEDTRVSSMLDFLDDIGDSFEDLVTVTAKTRNSNLVTTNTKITETENRINEFSEDLEIIYPTKILEFSKDFYETASYINGLEEENDIKTGLIISKNLHSELLADWAKDFADIYIDKFVQEYILNNPVKIAYSNLEVTNQDVKVTLISNVDFEVTNNFGNKEYIFTQNGSFTFEYKIKGQALTKTAEVKNIDKTSPVIRGIENDKLYTNSVLPQVNDNNLKSVNLYKNSELVQLYNINEPISADGRYKLVAEDFAGNKTEVEFYISKNPIEIKYSETNLTNKDVVVELVSSYDMQINNNSGNKIRTFTENGEFTFFVTIKGVNFEKSAKVNNIDKIPPKIDGVENNEVYNKEVKPIVSDENLLEIELTKDGNKVESYTFGNEIKENGKYIIKAKDLAGNVTQIAFEIQILSNEIKSEEYIINEQELTIGPILVETTVADLKQKLQSEMTYIITDANKNKIKDEEKLGTGYKVIMKDGKKYEIVVLGDLNGDAKISTVDVARLQKIIANVKDATKLEKMASDFSQNSRISILTLAKLQKLATKK